MKKEIKKLRYLISEMQFAARAVDKLTVEIEAATVDLEKLVGAGYMCPRCGGGIPNDEQRGRYPGALSRTDNKTEICSNCGTLEAIEQGYARSALCGRERVMPQSEWKWNASQQRQSSEVQ